jgi:hypothetical protein
MARDGKREGGGVGGWGGADRKDTDFIFLGGCLVISGERIAGRVQVANACWLPRGELKAACSTSS